jgi:hypothetical protein
MATTLDYEDSTLRRRRLIPIWVKVVYTAFMAVLIPIYWRSYGPNDFLWFCDAAAILTVFGLWLESPLIASINAVAMTLPQTIWIIDFLAIGHIVGVSKYMFDPGVQLYVRALSTFHIWLPVLLLWMVKRLGYDRRAIVYQIVLGTALLIASYMLTDPRRRPDYPSAAVNVNRVYGLDPVAAQTRFPPLAYLAVEIVFWPVVFFIPTHFLLRRAFRSPRR